MPSCWQTVMDLQTQTDIVYSYSTCECYHVHPDKSKCITFSMKFPPSVKLNDKEVDPTESQTHLGIDRYMAMTSHRRPLLTTASVSVDIQPMHLRVLGSMELMNGISPAISIHIYRTYVLPRVMYVLDDTILTSKHIGRGLHTPLVHPPPPTT